MFVGKNILYLNVFKRNDTRTIYNVIYRNGKEGLHYMKRFAVTGVTRDKEYDLTQGAPGSKIAWFSANPNGEAEILKIVFKPKPRLKTPFIEKDFSSIAIKGRQSMGNIVTHNEIHRISLKERGGSTLGGRQVWFDHDVLRLNYDGRGEYLGEFHNDEQILVILKNGIFYTTSFDAGNHYDPDILRIEKFMPQRCWTAALFDADQGYPYLKRFQFESSPKKQSFLGENPESQLILLSSEAYARIEVKFGGNDAFRDPLILEAADFIGLKSFRAKGKRITTFTVESISELEPLRHEEPETEQPRRREATNLGTGRKRTETAILTNKHSCNDRYARTTIKEKYFSHTPVSFRDGWHLGCVRSKNNNGRNTKRKPTGIRLDSTHDRQRNITRRLSLHKQLPRV